MGILLKVKTILLEYSGNRKFIEEQKVEIQKLNKKIVKQDKIIFELRSKNVKLTEEMENIRNNNNPKAWNKFEFYDLDIEEEILKNLSLAKKEVNIAVAWLTSECLINKLQELSNNGIIVNIIVSKDIEKEKKYYVESLKQLNNLSNEFRIIEVQSVNPKTKNYMHNKYCIIDDNKVIDGSYNWSENAKHSEEHIIVVESEIVAKMYKENFYRLMKSNSKDINILVI